MKRYVRSPENTSLTGTCLRRRYPHTLAWLQALKSKPSFSNKTHKPQGKKLSLNPDTNYSKYLREINLQPRSHPFIDARQICSVEEADSSKQTTRLAC